MPSPRPDSSLFPHGVGMPWSGTYHDSLRRQVRERQTSILEHAAYDALVRQARAAGPASSSARRSWLTRLRSFFRNRR